MASRYLVQMPSQATWTPELPADGLEIQESGNLEIWNPPPQTKKIHILRMQLCPDRKNASFEETHGPP